MANYALMSANSYAGWAVEASVGTAASVSLFTPVESPKVTPGVVWLDDSNFRGSPVMHYDQVQGVFKAMYDAKTFTYTDTYPNLLRAALGSTDTVGASVACVNAAGASVVGYPHTIGLINAPNTGSQAPTYTIVNDSVDDTYTMVASRLNTLSVSFSADAAVENTFQFITNQPTQGASVTYAVAESVQHLIPAWNCAASIGGVAVSVVEQMTLDIKRNTAQIFTLGSQSATTNFQGAIEVTGNATFVCYAGESFWANALVRDQQQVILNLVDPQTGYSILYRMSSCQLENPIIDVGKSYVEITFDLVAVANTVDAVNGGYSPLWTQSTVAQSTAF